VSWPIGKVSDIGDVISGFAFKSDWFGSGSAKVIRIGDLQNGRVQIEGAQTFDDSAHQIREQFKIRSGDILMALSGATVGKIAIADSSIEGAYLNQRVAVIRGKSNENTEYLKYVFSGSPLQKLLSNAGGAAQPNLSPKDLAEMEILLPPLTEQKRIAAILDKADAIRRKRDQAIQLANDFLRSVFLDMFGDPVTNPKGWEPAILGDLIHFAKDGPHVSPKYSEEGIPFLSTRHVKPAGIVWKGLKYITPEEADIHWKKCKPTLGDILYTKGGTTGIACAVDFEKDFAVWVHVALLRPKLDKVNYVWLTHMLNSKYCYQQSQRYTRGATNKDLGLKRMIDIEMYCPPIDEQNKFVEVKNRIDGLINKGHSFAKSDLFGSLSQKAFQGEL
jgi:type I restriction enzyme S subunit